jgi:hypothetical protein
VEDDWAAPRARDWGDDAAVSVEPGTAWATTRMGLSVMYHGLLIILYGLIGYVCLACLAFGLMAGRGAGQGAELLVGCIALLVVLAMLGGGITAFVGMCMCCAVPRESGARGHIIGSLLSALLVVLLAILFFAFLIIQAIQNKADPPPEAVFAGALVLGLLSLLSHVLFILFLRAVANFFHNTNLAKNAVVYLCCYVVFTGASFAVNFLLGAMARNPKLGDAAPVVILVGEALISLVFFILLIVLVGATRNTVQGKSFSGYR